MLKTLTSEYLHIAKNPCEERMWAEKETSMTIWCPDGVSMRDVPDRNEKKQRMRYHGTGLWPVRAIGDESLSTGFCYSTE